MDMTARKEAWKKQGEAALSTGLRKAYGAVGGFFAKRTPSAYLAPEAYDYRDKGGKTFTAGFGQATLLPGDVMQKTYYVAGYSENNPATGVLDEPQASALWLDDNTGRGALLFVSLDAVGLLHADVEAIRESLTDFSAVSGCRGVHILCTHDHAAIDTMGNWGPLPRSGRDKAYMAFLYAQIKKAAVDAYHDRRDGSLYLGTIEVPDMQEDIRTPIVYSKTLTRFRFAPKDGTREIWLLNFASHSESLQGCNSRISADFPGYLRRAILDKTGAQTVYCVGAIGGMISMQIENEREIRDAGGDFAASTKAIGEKLAGYAMAIRRDKKLSPCINVLRRELYLEADNTMLLTAKFVHILKAKTHFREETSLGLALRTEMTYMEIGGKPMLFVPGELFPELAYGGYLSAAESANGTGENPVPLCGIADDPDLLIFGMADDEIGYIVPPDDFLLNGTNPYFERTDDRHGRRHYEETNSLGPNTAQTIADTFTQMMQAVKAVQNP